MNESTISVNTSDVNKGMNSLSRNLSPAEIKKATYRAIRHTLGKARTESNREIRTVYKIPQANVNKAMMIKVDNGHTNQMPVGLLMASSSMTPISAFQPRMMNTMGSYTSVRRGALMSSLNTKRTLKLTDRKKVGLMEVEILKGKRKTIKSAFFLPGASKATVMARGEYSGEKSFLFRHKRISKGSDTPIDSLRTVSVFKAVITPKVQSSINAKLAPQYEQRLIHEMNFIISKASDKA